MNATLPIGSPSGWVHRIAKGLGFLAPAAARAERAPEAEAIAAIAKAAGHAGPVVILVTAFEMHGARVAELATPLARQGFAVETVDALPGDLQRAEKLDEIVAQRAAAAAAGRVVAGLIVASPRALGLLTQRLGEALPRVVMLDPRCGSPKCAGETRVPEAALHPRVLVVHDLADPDAAEAEAAAIVRAWGGAELFMTHGLGAPIRPSDGAFVGVIAEFLRREPTAAPAVPDFPMTTRMLRTGERVLVRRVVATDVARNQAFLDGLSQESLYNRFLAPRKLRPGEVARLTTLRPGREFAVAATVEDGGREVFVGVARYAATPEPDAVEVAVTVADAWQGKGLGEMLLSAVIAQAAKQGYERTNGLVLATNKPMQTLALKLGFSLRAAEDDPRLVEIERKVGDERRVAPLVLSTAKVAIA